MDLQLISYSIIVAGVAVLSRIPFLRFPMDEDFATYTYRARFAARGFKWKRDMFVFYATWRMHLLDKLYGSSDKGVLRIRLFLMGMHTVTSLAIFSAALIFTGNPLAAVIGGVLYAFFATAPSLCAESFNFEQLYLPFLVTGLQLLWVGPEMILLAGLCYGLAAIPKISTIVHVPAMMGFVAWQYGFEPMALFGVSALVPVLISHGLDWKMGYQDEEAKKQFRLRLAATLRCSKLKRMYGSIWADIKLIVKQTLPLWVAGVPGFFIFSTMEYGISIALFAAMVVVMILCQRGFSRYHYLPLIAFLALVSAISIDRALNMPATPLLFLAVTFGSVVVWTVRELLPFYLRSMDIDILARYREKYEQYIYLPYLGKILKRLVRMRKETHRRIFVWGNFVQLYHETGLPAADCCVHYCIGPWDDPILAEYFDTVIGGLMRHQPIYLIKTYPNFDMDLLEKTTGLKYQLIRVALARYPVYRLASYNPPGADPLSFSWQEKLRILEELTGQEACAPGINSTYVAAGQFRKALKECRKLLRLNPFDVDGLFLMGDLMGQMNMPRQSISYFERLLKADPNYAKARLMLVRQKMVLGRLDEASTLIKEEIRRSGENEETNYCMALFFQKTRQHQRAVEYFERIRTALPDRVDLWFDFADTLIELGEMDRCRKLCEETWELSAGPEGKWMRVRAAVTMAKLDAPRRTEAVTIERYLARDPQNELLSYARASALEKCGRQADASSLFGDLTRLSENEHIRAAAFFRLARLSPIDEREYTLRECLKLEPFHSGAKKLMGELEACNAQA